MKINPTMLSLPPYISTSWSNISAVYMKDSALVLNLFDGDTINVPDLKPETIETIFLQHATYLEQQGLHNSLHASYLQEKMTSPTSMPYLMDPHANIETSLRFGIAAMDELGTVMQHNPSQSNAPDLPSEVLNKIVAITNIVSPNDTVEIPRAEEKCNCFYCQIARALTSGIEAAAIPVKGEHLAQEEVVTAADLSFRQWDITQSGNKLFTVVNPLDSNERYSVYLGHPVGCTCGKEGCEHIVAVLKS